MEAFLVLKSFPDANRNPPRINCGAGFRAQTPSLANVIERVLKKNPGRAAAGRL
jgi:hypothetical protein